MRLKMQFKSVENWYRVSSMDSYVGVIRFETQKTFTCMIAEQTMMSGYNVSARVHCHYSGNQRT